VVKEKRVDIMCKKMSFGDALMLALAERYLPFVKTMVTWDNDHFEKKYAGKVLTPEEFIVNQV
jgi:predicted nucleic acid-binding protein